MIFRLLNGTGGLYSRAESRYENLSLRRFPKLDACKMREYFRIEQPPILLPTPMKGGDNPPQDRLATEEGHAQGLAIA
jgi:hypothetical protein